MFDAEGDQIGSHGPVPASTQVFQRIDQTSFGSRGPNRQGTTPTKGTK